MDLITFTEKAMPVPFLEKGRSYEGWDCWGLIYMAYLEVYGIQLPEYTGEYNSTRRREELQSLIAMHKAGEWELRQPHEPGDVALLRMLGRNCHVGIMLDELLILHVQDGTQAVVEPIDRPPWRDEEYNKVEGIYRHVLRI